MNWQSDGVRESSGSGAVHRLSAVHELLLPQGSGDEGRGRYICWGGEGSLPSEMTPPTATWQEGPQRTNSPVTFLCSQASLCGLPLARSNMESSRHPAPGPEQGGEGRDHTAQASLPTSQLGAEDDSWVAPESPHLPLSLLFHDLFRHWTPQPDRKPRKPNRASFSWVWANVHAAPSRPESANFIYEEPDSKYFHLFGPYSPSK